MEIFQVVARLVLSAVFLVAGIAKLSDLAGSRKAVADFGVPEKLAAPAGILLPVLEIVVAVALLPVATAWYGAMGALALLLVFLAAIGINLARGKKPDCHCFGQLHSAPVGRSTLIRNGVLVACAALVVWLGSANPVPSVLAVFSPLSGGGIVALFGGVAVATVLAVQMWFILHLTRQQGRLLLRLEALEARFDDPRETAASQPEQGLPIGVDAPSLELPDVAGNRVTLDDLRAGGKPILLVFSDPHCGPCNALLSEVGQWQKEHCDSFTLALISRGTVEENRSRSAEHGLTRVLLQKDREVAEAYGINGTPGAVLIRRDGKVANSAAMGADAIRTLVARMTRTPGMLTAPMKFSNKNGHKNGTALLNLSPTLKIGDPAPAIRLPDLDGKIMDLKDFRGHPVLVLFWNPSCGYCQRMLPDLKAREVHPSIETPNLLVVSTGTVEANRAMQLRSPIVLDAGFAVGHTFGSRSTPSAVLVDATGRIASAMQVGSAEVLKLAGIFQQPQLAASN